MGRKLVHAIVPVAVTLVLAAGLHWYVWQYIQTEDPKPLFYGPDATTATMVLFATLLGLGAAAAIVALVRQHSLSVEEPGLHESKEGLWLGIASILLMEALVCTWIALGNQVALWPAFAAVGLGTVQLSAIFLGVTARRGMTDEWSHYQPQVSDEEILLASTAAAPEMAPPACLTVVKEPGVTFQDVIGMAQAKKDLGQAIQIMESPELQQRHGLKPITGLLMHGPPGTGKTLFARAAAGEYGRRFFAVKTSDLVSKFHGESEKNVHAVFEYARQQAPAILFFDEIDAIASDRRYAQHGYETAVLTTLLTEMDGIDKDSRQPIVIAATNRLDRLDAAILRPGRFDRKVLVGLPDHGDRKALWQHYVGERGAGMDFDRLATDSHGMSPANIASVVQEAVREVFFENPKAEPRPIRMDDLRRAWRA